MSLRGVFLFAAILFSAVCARGDGTPAAVKVPAPDPGWVTTATKGIKTLYADDFAKAKTAEDKAALGQKLLGAAAEEKDSTGRFALLALARDTAIGAGDFVTAFAAIDQLNQGYQVDVSKMNLTAATAMAKGVATIGQRRLFMQALRPMVDQAILEDEYEDATQLCNMLTGAAQGIDDDTSKWAALKQRQAKESSTAMKTMKPALEALHTSPDDAEANLKVGKFRCFIKGDWEHGLPLLEKGSDAGIKAAAAADIKGASGSDPTAVAAQQIAVGDGWFDLAEKQTDAPEKKAMEQRAGKWYSRALPIAADDAKGKISGRLAKIQSVVGAQPAAPSTHSEEMIHEMKTKPQPAPWADGAVSLTGTERLALETPIVPPVTFDFVCQTDSNNLDFSYAADEISLAHGQDRKGLRMSGSVVGNQNYPGLGVIAPNQWVEIELAVTAKTFVVSVDGKTRATVQGDFSNVRQKFMIFTDSTAVIKVKSVVVTLPK